MLTDSPGEPLISSCWSQEATSTAILLLITVMTGLFLVLTLLAITAATHEHRIMPRVSHRCNQSLLGNVPSFSRFFFLRSSTGLSGLDAVWAV